MGRHKRSFTIEAELYGWIEKEARSKGILPSAQVNEMLSQAKQLIVDKERIWNEYLSKQAIKEGRDFFKLEEKE